MGSPSARVRAEGSVKNGGRLCKSLPYLEGLFALYLEPLTLAKKFLCKSLSSEALCDSNL